jgi:hypothetical protein
VIIAVNGELIDGFHFEEVPQFNRDDPYDEEALGPVAGMRAIWLLYKAGRWDYLEDLGVSRARVEPKLQRFKRYRTKLTLLQVRELYRMVPELVAASRELRLAYALKQYDKVDKIKRRKEQMPINVNSENPGQVFLSPVPGGSNEKAQEIVATHKDQIEAAGGYIDWGAGNDEQPAMIRLIMPANLTLNPANLLPGLGLSFYPVYGVRVPVPQKQEEVNDGE